MPTGCPYRLTTRTLTLTLPTLIGISRSCEYERICGTNKLNGWHRSIVIRFHRHVRDIRRTRFYISNSTVDNVVRLLMLSDECQTKMLKKTTIQFIDENENVLLKNESSFDVLKKPAPYLLVDI